MHDMARLTAICICLAPAPLAAATLRPFAQVNEPVVHLGDLFDQLGKTPDRVLGRAPAPGERIVIGSPQLAAIARDFNVDWRPATGGEQAVLERQGSQVPQAAIEARLREALNAAGAPDNAQILAPAPQPILVPAGSNATPEISQLSYDTHSGNFTALVSVHVADAASPQRRISGTVFAITDIAVATRHLAAGGIVAAADVTLGTARVAQLHGASAILPAAARGMILKHDVPAGEKLTEADLGRQILVRPGQIVRMTLNSAGISVSAEGRATQAGTLGDRVRVENPSSHLMVDAEITGAGEVVVAPRAAVATLAAVQ
jgi:flagella basal body P-ring formation protein FlgA